MENNTSMPALQNADRGEKIRKRITEVFATIAFQAAILFLSSWNLAWWEAWAYVASYLAMVMGLGIFLLRYNPQTIAERAENEGMKAWDKVVGGLFAIMYFVGILLVAGLDERFQWSPPLPLALQVVAMAVFVLGLALFGWAMVANAFFSKGVRVQEERGHAVCTTGPYRFARHPGYVGAILQTLALPFFLGSLWALIPAGLAVLFLIVRTALEDRTLHEELPGYAAYAQQVPYRLLPGVW